MTFNAIDVESVNLGPVIDALADVGYGVFDHLISDDVLQELLRLALQKVPDLWRSAGIGRGQQHHHNTDVRSDQIRWLSESDAPLFWSLMEHIRQNVNRALFMGLESFEGHCAHYAPGGHYDKHLDAFRGRSNRRLSTVLYLNRDWVPENGGQLRVFSPQNHQKVLMDVQPIWGRWVIFLSEAVPHEVLPAKADRLSVAGWFRGAEY